MDRIDFKGQMIDQVDLSAVPHSGFDRSNHNYFTGKLGRIIPTRLDEVYPGDRQKGSPVLVANFEPLASPLMGSMVLKQEAFFVSLHDLWRKSYHFFTGKNGFDENIPSISPRNIFAVYRENILGELIYTLGDDEAGYFNQLVLLLATYKDDNAHDTDTRYSDVDPIHYSMQQRFQYVVHEIDVALTNFYKTRKMADLIRPICDYAKTVADSEEVTHFSNRLEDVTLTNQQHITDLQDFSAIVGNLMLEFHQFFFGESSLFDYMGYPITLRKQFDYIPFEFNLINRYTKHGITNIFSKAVWDNIYTFGSNLDLDDLYLKFSDIPLNFLPFKAYYLVWYWNYRDQLLETDILDPEEDEFLGSDITDDVIFYCTMIRQRCWFKDAFTTALTNTGSGNLLVPTDTPAQETIGIKYYDLNDELINTSDFGDAVKSGATICELQDVNGVFYKIPINYLSGSSSLSSKDSDNLGYISLDLFDRIKRLRSFIQKKLVLGYEVDDVIWSSFMVKLSNVRMHIPELLGRGRDAVDISTVVNNTSTTEQIAGDKTAVAWCKGSISDINYFAEEWGFYIQLCTIMPIQTYAGGMQRLYLKKDVFDYMWPEFATMGLDAVYNCELAAPGSHLSDENALKVFGYQGRYYDLKYRQDEEHGRLLTDLNYLTFSREFDNDNQPHLNYMFVHCWPRLDGFVIENPLVDVFRADCYTAQGWERRLPVPSEYIH